MGTSLGKAGYLDAITNQLSKGASFITAASQGVASSVGSQLTQIALDGKGRLNWASVAINGISAGVGALAGYSDPKNGGGAARAGQYDRAIAAQIANGYRYAASDSLPPGVVSDTPTEYMRLNEISVYAKAPTATELAAFEAENLATQTADRLLQVKPILPEYLSNKIDNAMSDIAKNAIDEYYGLTKGQLFTMRAEGTYKETNELHWPKNASGVTLARGYDMRERTPEEVYNDLKNAGMDIINAKFLSKAAGLGGKEAQAFVLMNRKEFGTISNEVNDNLFSIAYAEKEKYAQSVYERATKNTLVASTWNGLKPNIRAVAIDFSYQGTSYAQMREIAKNNTDNLINYIKNTPKIYQYEKGRGRIDFLNQNRED